MLVDKNDVRALARCVALQGRLGVLLFLITGEQQGHLRVELPLDNGAHEAALAVLHHCSHGVELAVMHEIIHNGLHLGVVDVRSGALLLALLHKIRGESKRVGVALLQGRA